MPDQSEDETPGHDGGADEAPPPVISHPDWAVRSVERPPPPIHRQASRRGTHWWLPLFVVVSVLSVITGGVGYLLGRTTASGESGETAPTSASVTSAPAASTPTTIPSSTAPTTVPLTTATTVVPTTPPTTAATTSPPTTATATSTTPPTTVSGADDTRRAVFRGGVVYLGGEVPTQEVADAIAARVGEIVGPQNVVVEYIINPDAPVPAGAPLYVEDLVLFETATAVIADPFKPLLDLGTRLFAVNPTVTVEVIAHTDSIDTEEYNLALSQRRADAVKAYWVAAGVDPDRITAVGKGEAEPIAPNDTTDGRRLNRRAEFIVTGILG